MARNSKGIVYPNGWPVPKAQPHVSPMTDTLRAILYFNNREQISYDSLSGLVPDSVITPQTEMSRYG